MERAKIKVIGDVQGVFYRFSAKIMADNLGITGWAENEPDGSVAMVIEGESEAIKQFVRWAREGSPIAEVEKVEVEKEKYKGDIRSFEVR